METTAAETRAGRGLEGDPTPVARRMFNLTFHGIGSAPRPLSPGEGRVWMTSVRFLAILDAVAERRDVRLTFDDGNVSDMELALPALLERGLTATFFIVAGRLGTSGFLDDTDLAALVRAGMAIGSHGLEHVDWRRLSRAELEIQLARARGLLEAAADTAIATAAAPFGSYDRGVIETLRASGWDKLFTSDGGPATPDAFLQPRTSVCDSDDAESVVRLLSRGTPLERLTRVAKGAAKRYR